MLSKKIGVFLQGDLPMDQESQRRVEEEYSRCKKAESQRQVETEYSRCKEAADDVSWEDNLAWWKKRWQKQCKKPREKMIPYRKSVQFLFPSGKNEWTDYIDAQIKEQWEIYKTAQAAAPQQRETVQDPRTIKSAPECRRRLSMKPGMHQIDMTDECLEITPEGFPIVNEERPPLIQDHDTRRPLASLGNGTSTATGLVGIMSVSLTAVMGYVVWKASKMIRGSPRRRTSIDVRAVERASDSTEEANVIVDARFAQKKNTSGCTKELEAADKNNSN
eukprot:GHVT01044055.1.p1 GENE.GHVT01044055.1~~GHVT01044055.1.p1  ORF type:complete len:276 (+),score=29.35 GHVT01044055.1:2514-3341(+)